MAAKADQLIVSALLDDPARIKHHKGYEGRTDRRVGLHVLLLRRL